MADQGWIKLHRQITQCELWQEKPFDKARAWIDLIMSANHEAKNVMLGNQLIPIERGSFITSVRKLCDKWGWSNTKVIAFLSLLQAEQMITYKSDTKKTVVSLVNYGLYQDNSEEKRQQNDTKTTLKHTNKNEKNEKNEKKDIYTIFQHWISKGIVVHKAMSKSMESHINARLKDGYTAEEIIKAIDNYATILNNDNYFWSARWGISDFLLKGLDRFMDTSRPFENFKTNKPINPKPEPEQKPKIKIV